MLICPSFDDMHWMAYPSLVDKIHRTEPYIYSKRDEIVHDRWYLPEDIFVLRIVTSLPTVQ